MPTEVPKDTLMQELDHAAEQVSALYHQLPVILTRIALSGAVIVLGLLILRLIRRIISKRIGMKSLKGERTIKQAETLRSLITSVVNYLMYFLIAMLVLGIFGIDLTSLLAVAGIGSIAIGFGAQSLVKDVISGMFLWMEGNLNVGDIVTVAGQSGRVERLSLRTTVLRGADGSLFAIPNGDIRTVICKSRGQQVAQVNVTAAHGQDLKAIQAALNDECALLQERLALTHQPEVYPAIASDARCVTMRVECACEPDEVWALERELRLAMFERLRAEGFKA